VNCWGSKYFTRELKDKDLKELMENGVIPAAVDPKEKLATTWSKIKTK
jgi:hypothetical protein